MTDEQITDIGKWMVLFYDYNTEDYLPPPHTDGEIPLFATEKDAKECVENVKKEISEDDGELKIFKIIASEEF